MSYGKYWSVEKFSMSTCSSFWKLNFFYMPDKTNQLESIRTLGVMWTLRRLNSWTVLMETVQNMSPCFLQANCNLICGDEYGPETKMSMAQLNEKETPFELIEALLKYIETLNVPGAVLVFLPGWNLIYTMQKHLEMNPHFGMSLLWILNYLSEKWMILLAP